MSLFFEKSHITIVERSKRSPIPVGVLPFSILFFEEDTPMTIYETVKSAVTVRTAAEHYGLEVKRNDMT